MTDTCHFSFLLLQAVFHSIYSSSVKCLTIYKVTECYKSVCDVTLCVFLIQDKVQHIQDTVVYKQYDFMLTLTASGHIIISSDNLQQEHCENILLFFIIRTVDIYTFFTKYR